PVGGVPGAVDVEVTEDDLGPLVREAGGHGGADPAGGPGDQVDPAGQAPHAGDPPPSGRQYSSQTLFSGSAKYAVRTPQGRSAAGASTVPPASATTSSASSIAAAEEDWIAVVEPLKPGGEPVSAAESPTTAARVSRGNSTIEVAPS